MNRFSVENERRRSQGGVMELELKELRFNTSSSGFIREGIDPRASRVEMEGHVSTRGEYS